MLNMLTLCFRQVLHGSAGGMTQQVQARNQQLPGSTPVGSFLFNSFIICILYFFWSTDLYMNQDIKTEINPILNPRAPEGSLIGIPGLFSSFLCSPMMLLKIH